MGTSDCTSVLGNRGHEQCGPNFDNCSTEERDGNVRPFEKPKKPEKIPKQKENSDEEEEEESSSDMEFSSDEEGEPEL